MFGYSFIVIYSVIGQSILENVGSFLEEKVEVVHDAETDENTVNESYLNYSDTSSDEEPMDNIVVEDKTPEIEDIGAISNQRNDEHAAYRTYRHLRRLIAEAKERAARALSFAKLLRNDLEMTASFIRKNDVEITDLLDALASTNDPHVLVC